MKGYQPSLCRLFVFNFVVILTNPSQTVAEIQNLQYDSKLNFVSGTFVEYLPDPIFYDTFLPIVYEFPVPLHMENALKLLWEHATVCNVSDSRYDGKLCPVVHHLHKVVANLSSDMGFWKDFIPSPYGFLDADLNDTKSSSVVESSPNCDEIVPHFGNYYKSQEQIKKYLESISNCPLGQNIKPITQSSTWIVNKEIYYTMIDRFYSEFYRSLPGTGNVDWVVTLNSYTAIQGVLLSNNYMESNRLMNAFLSCQAGRIPETFVKTTILRDDLKNLKGKVNLNHFKYLWEKDTELSMYYKLPLADCTFTDDSKLIVRILIPVQIPDIVTKLAQIHTLPFLESVSAHNSTEHPETSLQLCKLDSPTNIKMIESNAGLLFETVCNPNELCKRSELNSFLPVDACMSAIITNNEDLISKNCHINCFPVDLKSLPIFRRKSSDTFIAVGSSDFKIFINCNRQPVEQFTLKDIGALEIKLACNCHMSYRNQVFQPLNPCTNEPTSVKHVLPLQWQSIIRYIGEGNGTGTGSSGIGNISIDETENALEESTSKNNVIKPDGTNKQKADKQIFIEPSQGTDGVSSGFLVQICLLWALVVVLVATNIFLIYHVSTLIKWRKREIYKDTRIVYSVPASPQFPSKF